ncbi:MAG: hypothetical protein K8T26_16585 [Lentisphaerae bacterium]|nr:hypothetical protein [Lentisphaerota bacterium]
MINPRDRDVLRRLGARKAEIGERPEQRVTLRLWADLNDLRPCRPLVWINEIPWHELEAADPEALRAVCADPVLRAIEGNLRRELYQWDHFRGDMVVEPRVYVPIVGGPTSSYANYGIVEQTRSSPDAADVVYLPVIHQESDAEAIRAPNVWYDRAETERRVGLVSEVLDGIMRVQRRGLVHQWHAPWDQIIHWYGIEQLYVDMMEKPELVHRVMANFCRALSEVLDRQTALGMLDVGNGNWRVGSGGMGCTRALPETVEGRPVTPRDQWGCSNAQIFSEVSPAMHEAFSVAYERPMLARFGMTYYGCCEPLHHKIPLMRSIPNLRKISISPKAKLRQAAEAIGRDYVMSFKPNPAQMATDAFHAEDVRASLAEAVAAMRGQPLEIILKDITTVRGDARRLDQWAAVAREVVEG